MNEETKYPHWFTYLLAAYPRRSPENPKLTAAIIAQHFDAIQLSEEGRLEVAKKAAARYEFFPSIAALRSLGETFKVLLAAEAEPSQAQMKARRLKWPVCPACEEHTPDLDDCPLCEDMAAARAEDESPYFVNSLGELEEKRRPLTAEEMQARRDELAVMQGFLLEVLV